MTVARVTPGCQFSSDNTAPMSPEAWAALEQANRDMLTDALAGRRRM